MKGECSRCGECCRFIVLPISGMSPEMLAYYRCRVSVRIRDSFWYRTIASTYKKRSLEMRYRVLQTAQ